MNVIKAREQWMASPNRHHWRPDEDELDNALRDAFAAGWNAARPAIQGVSSGSVTHNSAQVPDELKATIWGHTKDGQQVALTLGEADVRALLANLSRIGFYPS